jgi:hypothetical protein
MNNKWIVRLCSIALTIIIVVAGFGSAVLYSWNAVIPEVFGLPPLSFGQALCLLCLTWVLFGSWRGMPSWKMRDV